MFEVNASGRRGEEGNGEQKMAGIIECDIYKPVGLVGTLCQIKSILQH